MAEKAYREVFVLEYLGSWVGLRVYEAFVQGWLFVLWLRYWVLLWICTFWGVAFCRLHRGHVGFRLYVECREFNNLVFGLGSVAAWNSAMYDRDLGVYELLLFLVSDWF